VLRPGGPDDVAALRAILFEPDVSRWWGEPLPESELREVLAAEGDTTMLVIVVAGSVAGAIQFAEEADPMYRHAGLDIFLSVSFQGRGLGVEAIRLLSRYLTSVRGHHRLTIDPCAANTHAIACYAKVGFKPVGVLRRYERGPDGEFRDGLLMDLLAEELT